MTKRVLWLSLCMCALASCGEDEPKCGGGVAPCDDSMGSAEAGPGPTQGDAAATPSPNNSNAGDAGSGSNAGLDASGDPGRNDAGASVSGDAARPAAPDAGGSAARTDAGTTPVIMTGAKPSTGCGKPAPMAGKASIDVMGTMREYITALPQGYDPMKPYRLIFAWHGLGGTADQIARNWYGLAARAQNSTIFVAGQGLDTSNQVGSGPGWDNMGGRDVAFVKALYAQLRDTLCIDESRVFSTGMSYGGIMSNTVGCQMGDVFRAIAPMAGSGPGFGGRATCTGEVAVWMSHGDNDTVVPTASGQASRDFWVKANKCQMQTMPVEPSPCVAYQGCAADLPVTFCLFPGGHTVPPFAAAAIWSFFAQF